MRQARFVPSGRLAMWLSRAKAQVRMSDEDVRHQGCGRCAPTTKGVNTCNSLPLPRALLKLKVTTRIDSRHSQYRFLCVNVCCPPQTGHRLPLALGQLKTSPVWLDMSRITVYCHCFAHDTWNKEAIPVNETVDTFGPWGNPMPLSKALVAKKKTKRSDLA